MFPSYLLALREGLEAALIIGIVLGVLRKINRSPLKRFVWMGAGSAVLVSILSAWILNIFGASFEGAAEQIFEGMTMFIAAGVLTWMIFWMQRQARTIKSELEADVTRAVMEGGQKALFLLSFVAVVREGVELALFLTAASMTTSAQQTLTGAILGLGTSVLLGWSLFVTTVRLDLRRFFQVTGLLLILFAAGLVAYGIHEFNEVGWIPSVIEHVWDVNHVVDEKSTWGLVLKALFGYNGNPSLTEVLGYGVYFVAIWLGLKRSKDTLPAVQGA